VAPAEGASVQSWDVPGAYMRAPVDPLYRVTMMQQSPNFDRTLAPPDKGYAIRRAMPGAPDANALWEHFRDYWFKTGDGPRFCLSPACSYQKWGPASMREWRPTPTTSHNGAHRGSH
jgi:hypothetical protein